MDNLFYVLQRSVTKATVALINSTQLKNDLICTNITLNTSNLLDSLKSRESAGVQMIIKRTVSSTKETFGWIIILMKLKAHTSVYRLGNELFHK